MKFGTFPLAQCEGAILSHSLKLNDATRFKKGQILSKTDLEIIEKNGDKELLVAILDENDIGEDEAASRIAKCLAGNNIRAAIAGTGRVNLYAQTSGLFFAHKDFVDQVNNIHPDITLATLSDKIPIQKDTMVATVKIIPYGVAKENVEQVEEICRNIVIDVTPYKPMKIGVVLSELPTLKDSVKKKTLAALETRLSSTGSSIVDVLYVAHEQDEIQSAIDEISKKSDITIIFGASAISDIGDFIPQAVLNLDGKIERFGMPVDPGNLLLLGSLEGKTIIGAPGCARSIAENGFDFVLKRVLCGQEISSQQIANMGVGGLLLEIPTRPSPREKLQTSQLKVCAIVLAAGQSSRMGKDNKLLAKLDGKALVRHVVDACNESKLTGINVVIGHQKNLILSALDINDVNFVDNPDFELGLSTSLKEGILNVCDDATHAMVLLGDMPKISATMINQMIECAYNNPSGSIIMATSAGKRGNPVLWPRQYFDRLTNIKGDVGAKHILFEYGEQIVEVEIGEAASLDVDTQSELAAIGGELNKTA